jgi:hypothetical protein
MNRLGQLDTALVGDSKRQLQLGEHTCAAGDRERHAAQLAQKLVPTFQGHAAPASKKIKQLLEAFETVGRQLNGTS